MFGQELRGRQVKNDYVIDSSNSEYPYASRIQFQEEVSFAIGIGFSTNKSDLSLST